MRLFLLTALTMMAFAANSLLNRIALAEGDIDAVGFAMLRLLSGALCLGVLLVIRGQERPAMGVRRWIGVGALLLYLFGFSAAYGALDAGIGALILFGVVQITMLGGAVLGGERPTGLGWLGAGLAFGGLVWLMWPVGAVPLSLPHAASMTAAGIGWGLYSLAGRGEADATGATAMNFILAVPAGVILWMVLGGGWPETYRAALWAVLSGMVTSGLGYALWYSVIPALGATRAAVSQLTVPVIAVAGGVLLLGEAAGPRLLVAAALVLGGVALSLRRP